MARICRVCISFNRETVEELLTDGASPQFVSQMVEGLTSLEIYRHLKSCMDVASIPTVEEFGIKLIERADYLKGAATGATTRLGCCPNHEDNSPDAAFCIWCGAPR